MKITQQNNPTGAMAKLLASRKNSFVSLHKGETVKGKIVKLTSSEILVDVGAKTDALVLEKDHNILHTILAAFKLGETVEVMVLSPESETGQPIVSLRRFLGNIAWNELEKLQENGEAIEVKVTEMAKAGYVAVSPFGLSGFLPQSHTSFAENTEITIGDKLSVTVLELNRKDNKIIFSQKPVFTNEDFQKITSLFKPEQKVKVTIINVASFGLFVSLPVPDSKISLEGFIHISEVAWEKTVDLGSLYKAGQQIDAVVLKFDNEARKVQLSIRRLTKDPFVEIMAKFPIDKKINGNIINVSETGVTVELGEGVEGFIKPEKIPPTVTYKAGQQIDVLVSEFDKKRKKISLVPVLREKPIGYR